MNQSILKILRAVAGLAVVLILFATVRGWWTDYKEAPRAKTAEATATAAPTDKKLSNATQPVDATGTLSVLTDGLNLRTKPAIDGDQIRGLKKKEKLTLIKKQGDWYFVKTSKDEEGWVSANKSYTKLIKK